MRAKRFRSREQSEEKKTGADSNQGSQHREIIEKEK